MDWNLIADSSCDLRSADFLPPQHADCRYANIPFLLEIGGEAFVDDDSLDSDRMVDAMEHCRHASHSACPAPGAWLEEFRKAKNSVAVTISSGVSGSYASALAAKNMALEEDPHRNICVIDSLSAGPALAMILQRAAGYIEEGHTFDALSDRLSRYARSLKTYFALSSYENLVKSGRISRLSGFVAGKLGIRAVGTANEEGRIVLKHKTRGAARLLSLLLDEMGHNGFCGGSVYVSHCQNSELAEKFRQSVLLRWPRAQVTVLETRGLCSYYAERSGLITAF